MLRELALRVVLVLVGLPFTAAIYPAAEILWYRDQPKYETAMGLAVYATLGIILLMALRNPLAHRSPDRLCGMVELCSLFGNGVNGSPRSAVTGRVATSRYLRSHRHSPSCAGSGKGFRK